MINTPLLTFNAKSVSCEKLEKALTARRPMADRTFNNLKRNITLGGNYQSLIVAPRGSGKSHLTKVMYCRIIADKELRDKVLVAYMIEDESGIASFMHLLLHILDALHRYNEPGAESVPAIKQEISEISSKRQTAAFENALLTILGERRLVLLVENFDNIIAQMGDNGAGLRDFMHNYDKISILATSQNLSEKLNSSKYPFYQFFDTQQLNKLSFDEMIELVEALISIEEDELLKSNLTRSLNDPNQDFKAKLRAIYELTMGNHRLIVDFYSFLKADIKSDLSTVFIRQMNNLKSYYEQFIKELTTQQQRIVQVLSQNRKPITPKEISQKAFLKTNSVTKQLNELEKLGYVDVHKIGRNSLYELNEPLMRISYEINENPSGIATLFVNFLKAVYDRKYLIKHYFKFKYGQHILPNLKEKYSREMELHRRAIGVELKLEKYQIEEFKNIDCLVELETKTENLAELEEAYRTVFEYYDRKEFEEALQELDQFKEEERNELYFNLRGSAKSGLKDYESAIKDYNKAIKLRSNYKSAYYNLGLSYSNLSEWDEALMHFRKAHSLDQNDEAVLYNIGITYSNLRQYELSIEAFEQFLDIVPESETAYGNIGLSNMNLEKYESAINNFEKILEINPESEMAYGNIGLSYMNLEKYEPAINNFKKILETNPDNEIALGYIGLSNMNLKDYEATIKSFRKVLTINPKSEIAHENIGLSNMNLEKYESAINSFEKVLELNPKSEIAYGNIGLSNMNLEKYESAIKNFEKILEINPDSESAYEYLGACHLELGEHENAIEYLEKVLKLNPDNDIANANLGLTHFKNKNFETSIQYYKKCISQNTTNTTAYINLGAAFMMIGDFEKARKSFEKAVELNSAEPDTLYNLGTANFALNNFDSAIDNYLKVVKISPNNILARIELVRLNLYTNNSESALEHWMIVKPLLSSGDVVLQFLNNIFQIWVKKPDLPISLAFDIFIELLNLNHEKVDEYISVNILHALTVVDKNKKVAYQNLHQKYMERFGDDSRLTLTNKYFDIGLRYLVFEEKNAIYDFTKEERKVFLDVVEKG